MNSLLVVVDWGGGGEHFLDFCQPLYLIKECSFFFLAVY
jgi:hypothetical protein